MNRLLAAVAVLALFIVAVFSIRLAWADFEFRRGTEESVARAVGILPNNISYRLFRALQLDYAGTDSTGELERAAALSPMSSAPRLQLGLKAEARGDLTTAERWLLDAARVDHQFEPRWTLANFYFRQDRREDFWKWMRSALEVSYGDRKAAFDLCWRVGKDAGEILKRGVPMQREVLAAMLLYALDRHPEDAGTIGAELAKVRDASDLPLLDRACSALIQSGDAEGAARLWIAAGHSPAGGVWNGNFASAPLNAGFDWRIEQPPGIVHVNLGAQGGHRIQLSGQQPEAARLLSQIVLLDPGRRYRLEWSARTNGLADITGLVWIFGNQRFPLAASSDLKKDLKNEGGVVTAPQRLTPLELWYQRPNGQVREEGWIEIHQVSLTLVP